jgi:TrmH family RNA methyltransferase
VIFDGVQDPGNAGAIIRSCEAFGFDCAIFSNDSADVYNPKVVRASAGSAFRLPELRGNLCELIPKLKQVGGDCCAGFTVYAAALDENATPLRNIEKTEKIAVVIGNEGRGVSDEIAALCDRKLYIPIRGAESLNASVAAGIICYELGGKV